MTMNQPPLDPAFEDPEVRISQIVQSIFLIGFLAGRNELQDDFDAGGSPLAQQVAALQQKFNQLMPASKESASANSFMDFINKVESNKVKQPKVRLDNENLTQNDRKLNAIHDKIVKDLIGSLEEEAKQVSANLIKETKHLKKG